MTLNEKAQICLGSFNCTECVLRNECDERNFGFGFTAAEVGVKAIEKQIPKQVYIRIRNDGLKRCYCGYCGCYFGFPGDWVVPLETEYCPKCGQKIGWEDME